MAQGIAICLAAARHKNQKVMDLALPGTLSQICGVGEPLMYSVLIPLKRIILDIFYRGCVAVPYWELLGTRDLYVWRRAVFLPNFVVSAASGTTDLDRSTASV